MRQVTGGGLPGLQQQPTTTQQRAPDDDEAVSHATRRNLSGRAAGDSSEQAAVVAHDAGHHHRPRRCDHDGRAGKRRAEAVQARIAALGPTLLSIYPDNRSAAASIMFDQR